MEVQPKEKNARLICNVVVVDDRLAQAQMAAQALVVSLETNVADRTARGEATENVYCVSLLAPKQDESGDEFWTRCQKAFSESPKQANQHLWTSNAESFEKSMVSHQTHVLVADFLFDELNWAGETKTGLELISFARKRNPSLLCFLFTGVNPKAYEKQNLDHIRLVLPKGTMGNPGALRDFALEVDEHLQSEMKSPFWQGLVEYATEPSKIILHAMAAADGQSLMQDATTKDYAEFFGSRYFQAEASLTLPPLDSLLSPQHSIKQSQELYAAAFGADYARFSTNGTSAANTIINLAFSRRGDYIFVDQNCHISHHFSYVRSGATPVFLEAEQLGYPDEYSAVRPAELGTKLRRILKSADDVENAPLPKIIVLTNCTFDGVAVRPDYYIRSVFSVLMEFSIGERLKEIVFLFDEAWWGFARFDTRLIEYTAMYQVDLLRSEDDIYQSFLRVYATHSTHKTLSSFRQTSAILVSDPLYDPDNHSAASLNLEQSYLASTTTSPHAGMIASFDVARRQARLTGARIIAESEYFANEFKSWLQRQRDTGSKVGKLFRVVSDSELLGSLNKVGIVDPTKVTIELSGAMSGPEAKERLWTKMSIQFNKYSRRRCLLMFTIGFRPEKLETLKLKLTRFADQHSDIIDQEQKQFETLKRRSNITTLLNDGSEAMFPEELHKRAQWDMSELVFGDAVASFSKRIISIDEIISLLDKGEKIYVANFVTPYPPGFPVLYPGQKLDIESSQFIRDMEDIEVHGVLLKQGKRFLSVFVPND